METDAISSSSTDVESPDQEMLVPPTAAGAAAGGSSDDAIPLPDIRQALKKKAVEEELKRMEAEKEAARVKIKRSDKEAFRKVCHVVECELFGFWRRIFIWGRHIPI